jgi:hypothetical protein
MLPRPKSLRSVAVIGGLVGLLGLAVYPIVVDPKLHPEKYRQQQKWLREKVPLEDTQPGGELAIVVYNFAWHYPVWSSEFNEVHTFPNSG